MPDNHLIKMTPQQQFAVKEETAYMVRTHLEAEGKWVDRNRDELETEIHNRITGTSEPGFMAPQRAHAVNEITGRQVTHRRAAKHHQRSSSRDAESHQGRGGR